MGFPIKREKLRIVNDIASNLRWVIGIVKGYRAKLYLYMLFLMLTTVYSLFLASRMGGVIDLALSDNMNSLIEKSTILAVLYALNLLLGLSGDRISAVLFNRMYNDLNLQAYSKIMDSSWEELTEFHSGDLITRLTSDVKSVALNTCRLIPSTLSKLFMAVIAGIYILAMDYTMILVAVFVAPIVLISSRAFMGKVYESHVIIKNIEAGINSYNKETFNNIQAVKAFNLGKYFYNKMNGMESKRMDADLKSNKYSLLSLLISFITELTGAFLCIGWMYYRVHIGVITFGSLTILAFLAFQIGSSLKGILNLVPEIMEYVASADRLRRLIQLREEESVPSESFMDLESVGTIHGVAIHIEDMYFRYKNGYSVFEGASLYAKPGEIIALVGPSGEGKTTMLRLILGIVTAIKGNTYASVGDKRFWLGKQTRCIISYVPQGNTMMAGSILDNMRIIKQDAKETEIVDALKTACIYDFVSSLPEGLEHVLGESGLGFSEGQNQRLAIARALLKNSPILLMDEATSALDVATERTILYNIMQRNPKKTVILTTHRPTVLSMCDRVYRIAEKTVSVIGKDDIKKLMDEF